MGGYAWRIPNLYRHYSLWLAFMRSGREDIFTMAEAMSRHSADVDIYHFGDLKGLGSRHNVYCIGAIPAKNRVSLWRDITEHCII